MSRRLPIPHPTTGAFPPDLSLPGNCSPSDIIYCSSPESEEEDKVQNSAKRRRIEYHADRYLRGETLYLHSARLRGPVINNPWAKRKLSERPGNVQTKPAATSKTKGVPAKKKATTNGEHQQQTNLKEKLKSSKSKNVDGTKEGKGKKGNDKRAYEGDSAALTDDAEEVMVAASVKGLQPKRVSMMAQDSVVFDSPRQPLPTYDIDSIPSTRQQMDDDDDEEEDEDRLVKTSTWPKELFESKSSGCHQASAKYSPSTTLKQNLPRISATRANVQAPPSPTPHANTRKRKAPPPRPRSELPLKKPEVTPQSLIQPNRAGLFAKSVANLKQKDTLVEGQIVREKHGNQAAAFAALSPFEFRYTNKAQAPRPSSTLGGENRVMDTDDNAAIGYDANNNTEEMAPSRRAESPQKKRVRAGLATFSPGTAYRGKKPKNLADKPNPIQRLESTEQVDEDDGDPQDANPPPPKRARKETKKTTGAKTTKADVEAPAKAPKKPAPKPKAKPQPKPKKKTEPAPKPKPKPKPKPRTRGKKQEESEQDKIVEVTEDAPNDEKTSASDGKDARDVKNGQVNTAVEATVVPTVSIAKEPEHDKQPLETEGTVQPQPLVSPRNVTPPVPIQSLSTTKAKLQPTKETEGVDLVAQATKSPVTAQRVTSVVQNHIPGNLSPVSPLDDPVTRNLNDGFPATLPSPLEVRSRAKTISPRKPANTKNQNKNAKQKTAVALSDNDPPTSSRLSSPPPSSELDREESTIEMSSGRFRDALMHSAQKAQLGTEDDVHLPEDAITPHVPLNTQAEFLAAANSFNRCLANSPVKFADYTAAPAQNTSRNSLSFTAINSPDRPAPSTVDEKEQAKRRLFRTSPLKNNQFTPFNSIDQKSPSKGQVSFFGASTQRTSHSFNTGAYSPLTYSPFAPDQVPVSPSRGGHENPPMPSQSPARSESTNWLDDVLGQTEAYLEKDTWNIEEEAKVEAARKTPATTRKGKILSSQPRISS